MSIPLLSIFKADDPKFKAKVDAAKSEQEKMAIEITGVTLAMLKMLIERKDKLADGTKLKDFLGTLELSKPFWEGHIVQQAQTDFNGHAIFKDLKPGDYWILGEIETRAAFTLWNLKVNVKPGENKLLLDQNNALFSK